MLAGVYAGWRFLKPVQPTFERLTYRRGEIPSAKFSPDGQTVVFSAQWANEPTNIFSMRPGSREYRPLDLPEGRILAISSTGEMAILLGPTTNGTAGTLARVPLSGGAPREILENVNDADWSPDGSTLAVSRTVGGKNRIEYPIGTVRYENDGRSPELLRVSPKGDLIAFFEHDNDVGDYTVTVLDMNGKKRALSRGWQALGGLAWSPEGRRDLVRRSEGGRGTGVARRDAERKRAPGGGDARVRCWWTISRAIRRSLVTVVDSRLGISALAPGAKQESDLSWFDASQVYDISADGKTILFVELSYGQARNPAIYLRKTDGSQAVRLGDGNRPALSPDGKFVACILNNGPKTELSLLPTGPGEARVFSTPGMHYERVEWFPDGEKLLFTGNEPNRPMRTYLQDIRGGAPMPRDAGRNAGVACFARWKICDGGGGGKLNLVPIAGAAAKPAVDVEAGESVVRWSADGRYLVSAAERRPHGGEDQPAGSGERPRGAVERTEAGRSGGRADRTSGHDAGWERVCVFVPARHLHAVSGGWTEVIGDHRCAITSRIARV